MNHNLWTIENGTCWPFRRQKISEADIATKLTNDPCLLRVKCRLAGINKRNKCYCPLDKLCQLKYDDAELLEKCAEPIAYPPHGLLRPYMHTYFMLNDVLDSKREPWMYKINGSISCRGYHATTLGAEVLLALNGVSDYQTESNCMCDVADIPAGLEYLFCHNNDIFQNESRKAPQSDKLCWSEVAKTLGTNKSYSFLDACPGHPQCLSSYRINDGYDDCYDARDEDRKDYPQSCVNIRKYRLQCSLEEQPMCLAPDLVGSYSPDCHNSYDEFFFHSNIHIQGVKCDYQDDNGCAALRDYIEMTTKNNTREAMDSFVQSFRETSYSRIIPHSYYCNTVLDLSTNVDELPEYCRQWICREHQYQCPNTGQCIDPEWLCDGRLALFFSQSEG